MGLNESYSNLRSHILSRIASVTVNEAYATMAQDESQRLLGVVDAQKDPLTMMTGRPQGYRSRKPGGSGGLVELEEAMEVLEELEYLVYIVDTKVI